MNDMTLPDIVSKYLSSTRYMLPFSSNATSETFSDLVYRPIVEYVNALSNVFGLKVDINIIYSDALRSEAIAIGGNMYIVHDRYLGQTVNMLNRLFLYNSSNRTKIIYSHKLVSHSLSRYGFYEEAVFAARTYQNGRDDMDHQEKQKQDGSLVHGVYTHVQELYILLHEHTHHVFRIDKKLLADVSDDVREWIRSFGNRESRKDFLMSALLDSDDPGDEIEFYKSNIDSIIENVKLSDKYCEEISNRSDLVEEFCCDRIAIIHMVPYLRRMSQLKPIDYIKAIVLCFLHLRTIQLLEARCSLEKNYNFEERQNIFDIQENLYSVFYNARLHHIKEFCYDLFISSDDEYKIAHSVVSKMMYVHTDEILSPAESVMTNLLYSREIRDLMKDEFAFIKENMSESQHIKRVVSAILYSVLPKDN